MVVTVAAAPFASSHVDSAPLGGDKPPAHAITVDSARRAQRIESFGGAFNEQGWDALSVLSAEERDGVLRALFDAKNGLAFDYCRLPIGASDYAMSRYTLDESPGDYAMEHFSIARDQERLIPYVKAAQRWRPELRFWGSAWTPPTWMKTNAAFDGGAMKDEPRVYDAYALYLAKFVESYAQQGIPVDMVVPQNEPGQLTDYPSCDWRPAQYTTFLRDHAGPLFKQRGLTTKLFVGTINQYQWDVLSVLRDAGAAAYISGVTLQWQGLPHAAKIRELRPELPILQSETECGNNHWEPGFNPDEPPNDFAYAVYTWRKFRDYFNQGASSYMLWNMVLDEEGKNLDSKRPWPQNSPVVVDRKQRRVTYTPMYWATKHFSALIARGAHRVESSGGYADRIAFSNPDGSAVVELLNESAAPVSLELIANARRQSVRLPPRSFVTVVVPPA